MTSGTTRRIAATTGVAIALVAVAMPARAQSGLESVIKQFSGATIQGYIQPLADALVGNLSVGYVNSGPAPGRKFSFSLELVGMTAAVDDAMRVYTAATPNGFQPATVQAPTIFGGAATAVNHSTIPGLSYRPSDGLVDAEYFPTAGPQIRLGGLLGTELVIRYATSAMVPMLEEEDFPDLSILGIGVQHNLSQYLKLPVDLTIGGSFNSLKFGDIVDLSSTSFGLNVGRSFGLLGVSGGLQSDGGTMNLTYTSNDPNAPGSVDVDLDVKRAMRFRAGASLNLGFIRLFGDAAFGDVTSYAAGLRLGF
jgi:hypothetical protein